MSKVEEGRARQWQDKVKVKDGIASRVVLLERKLCPESAGSKFEKLREKQVETIEGTFGRTCTLIENRNVVAAGRRRG